jgi:hypothetical protein
VARSSKIGAIGIGLVVLANVAGCGGGGAGPLGEPKGSGPGFNTVGLPVKTHEFAVTAIPFYGGLIDRPLELLGVRLFHPEDAHGLTIRYGAKTIRGAAIGGGRGWRAAARGVKPVAGYLVHRHTSTEIVIGAAAAKPGIYRLRGFIIDYRIKDTHYHAPQHFELEVCAGRKTCPG